MQHISVILAHPYTHSLNAAIAATVVATLEKNGYSVHFHDLYQEGFNPLINGQELVADDSSDPLLRQHQEEICRAHGIIIVHPNWWGQPPAILKGWVDRVLRENTACPSANCRPKPPWSSTPQTPPPSANRTSSATRSSASGKTASSPSAASTPLTVSCSGLSPTATKRHGSTGCNKRRKWSTNTSLPPHKTLPHPL